MSKKWPLRPKPRSYQLLYRWIEELAEIYGVSYQTFCKNALGLSPQEIGSLNTFLPERVLIILSNGTNIPIEDLRWRELHTSFKRLLQMCEKIMEENPDAFFSLQKSVHKPPEDIYRQD